MNKEVKKKEEGVPEQTARQHREKRFLRVLVLTLVCAMALCPAAFATEGSGGDLSAITGSVSTVTSLLSSVFSLITGNPLLAAYVAIGLLGSVILLFRKLKRASH